MTTPPHRKPKPTFRERLQNMSDDEVAVFIASGLNDRELLLDIRQAWLAKVAAIEKKLIAEGVLKGPSTAECRRIAKGKT